MSANLPDVDAYVKLVRTAEALHSEVSRGLAKENITASQFSALKALRYQGPMPQKYIASYLLKSAGNVTMVLDNLEKQGLITRTRQTDDRRLVSVSLTEQGRIKFDRMHPPHLERIHKAMQALSSEDLDSLNQLLSKLHTTVNEPACGPVPLEEASSA